MALFKISKGTASELLTGNNSRYAREGSAWFTTDDGKFYIDVSGDGQTTSAVIGTNRIPLNAAQADEAAKVTNSLTIKFGSSSASTENTNLFTYNGSAGKNVVITPAAIGAIAKAGDTMTGFLTLHADPTSAMHAVTKQYADGLIAAADAMVYKGTLNGGVTKADSTYTPAANAGWTYRVATAGWINNQPVEVGDLIICNTDNTPAASTTNLTNTTDVAHKWNIIQVNVDKAVYYGDSLILDGAVALFSGGSGKVKAALPTGSTTQPIYLNNGIPTAIQYTANRLYYSASKDSFAATNHYASDTKIAINSTSAPGSALHVNGTTTTTDSITVTMANTAGPKVSVSNGTYHTDLFIDTYGTNHGIYDAIANNRGTSGVTNQAAGWIIYRDNSRVYIPAWNSIGSVSKPIYIDGTGHPATVAWELKATVNSGVTNKIAYYSGENAISSGTITTDGTYLGSVSYLSVNTEHQTTYRLYVTGESWIKGKLWTQDLYPDTDTSYDLGSSSYKWRAINLAGSAATAGENLLTHGINIASAHIGVNTDNNTLAIDSIGNVEIRPSTGALTTNGIVFAPSSVHANRNNIVDLGTNISLWKDIYGHNLILKRIAGQKNGIIKFYSPGYNIWSVYMDTADVAGGAPNSATTSKLGNVTTWSLHSYIENTSGYGWIWESSDKDSETTPTPRMGLSSANGQLRIASNAATSTNESGGLIISSAENGSDGNISLELWRGTKASWQIANEDDILYFRNNYTTIKQTTYVNTVLSLRYGAAADQVVTFETTKDATDLETAGVVIKGGTSIAKKLRVGDAIFLHGQSTSSATINYTRVGYNYINIPTDAHLAVSINGSTGSNIRLDVGNESITSYTNNTVTLGTSAIRWKYLYAYDINLGPSGTRTISYTGTKSTGNMIQFLDNDTDTYGNGIKIGGGGVVVIGSGESAANMTVTPSQEQTYILADNAINIEAGADTIANRVGVQVTTAGHLLPIKAETANNLLQDIGSNTDRWRNIYANALYLQGPSSDPSDSTGARIVFSYDASTNVGGSQPVYLSYTPNDSYRAAAGLKLFGGQENTWFEIAGTVYIKPTSGSYREGLRIYPYSSWSTIMLGGNDLGNDSGSSANSWGIYNNNGNFWISRNASGASGTYALGHDGTNWLSKGHFAPQSNNTYNLGTSSLRWKNIYFYGAIAKTTRHYPYIGSAERSAWYRITFPYSNAETTTAAKWFMNSFDIHVGGGYQSNPSGLIHVAFYWMRAASNGAWTAPQVQAYAQGPYMNKVNLYYRIAEPGVLYVNVNANVYNGISVQDLYCDDTAPTLDWTTTTVTTCSAITVTDYTAVPMTRFYNEGSRNSFAGVGTAPNLTYNSRTIAPRFVNYGIFYSDSWIEAAGGFILNRSTAGGGYNLMIDGINYGFLQVQAKGVAPTATTTNGTTTYTGAVQGYARLCLGNNRVGANSASGVANNAYGQILLYDTDDSYLYMNGNGYIYNKVIHIRHTTGSLYIETTTTNNWSYLRLHNNSSYWDIGTIANSSPANALQFRPAAVTRAMIKTDGEICSQAANAFRAYYGNYGVFMRNDGSNFYFLLTNSGSALTGSYNSLRPLYITLSNGYVYSGTRIYGAVWNDYAEFRHTEEIIEPGRVVRETGIDNLVLTTERLQPGCEIVSDTYGFSIGQSKHNNTPTAASGRVLAYPNEDISEYHPGDAVCSGPNGTVSRMTREEIKEYPERIIGTVSEIPNYETWSAKNPDNNDKESIKVNGRIWIRIR